MRCTGVPCQSLLWRHPGIQSADSYTPNVARMNTILGTELSPPLSVEQSTSVDEWPVTVGMCFSLSTEDFRGTLQHLWFGTGASLIESLLSQVNPDVENSSEWYCATYQVYMHWCWQLSADQPLYHWHSVSSQHHQMKALQHLHQLSHNIPLISYKKTQQQ